MIGKVNCAISGYRKAPAAILRRSAWVPAWTHRHLGKAQITSHTHIYIYIPEKCRKELQISNTAPAAIVNLERNQVRASMSCVFHIQRKVGWQLNTLRLGKLARTLKMKLCSHFYLRTSTGPCHATSVPAQLPLLMWNSFFHLAMASTLEMHHWSPLRQPRAWTYTSHHCSYIKGYWSLLYF